MPTNTHPFTPEMKECPFPRYDEWREDAPLVWSPEVEAWLVTSYEEAKAILANHQVFSSSNSVFGGPALEHPEFPSMINRDEPDHRRLRALVSKAFTPRTIEEAWEPRIRQVVEELVDGVLARGDGRLDIVRDVAYPLPVKIIAEIIGVPPERFEQFKTWSNEIVSRIGRVPEHGYRSMEQAAEAAEEALAEREHHRDDAEAPGGGPDESIFAYFAQEVEMRRAQPRDDLVTRLVQAEVDGRQLDLPELVSFLVLLLVAGNETTTNLMNHSVRAMAEHPELQQRVRDQPELMEKLLEEALRWESPIQGFYRRARQDIEVGGVQVKTGDALLVLFGAANRDPEKYECPADFDLERFDGQTGTRDHLAFGYGIHYCLGANLARMEARIAMQTVLTRLGELRSVEGQRVEWWDAPFFRSPKAYVVTYQPRA
ncbi:MAG: cytochrome P450 [Dehalococcoidia bacterium]|nr:cytochrome P450 [Dehalococcoidia bacterium]